MNRAVHKAVHKRARPAALLAATIAFAATSCGASGGDGTSAQAAPTAVGCALALGDDDPTEADGALVVMLDGTVSSAEERDRVADVVSLVDATTVDQALSVSIGSFGGSDDEVRYSTCPDGIVFVADGNNARTRERNRPALIDGLTQEISGLEAGYEASDPTSALRAGIRRLEEIDGLRALVIHTDGIATAGCAELPDEINLSEPGLIADLTTACTEAGQLPSADGVEIVIGGIGRTSQDLDSASVTFLIELNTALCEATGATCRVDPNLPADV